MGVQAITLSFRGLKMQFDGHYYKPLHLKQIVRAKNI